MLVAPRRKSWQEQLGVAALLALLGFALFWPPIAYLTRSFRLPCCDIGLMTRTIYNCWVTGTCYTHADHTGDFQAEVHFVPFLWLISPFIYWTGRAGYFWLTCACLVGGSFYAYRLALAVTQRRSVAIALGLALLLNPYTSSVALSFHWEACAVLMLLGFASHAYSGEVKRASLYLLLALVIKEDIWLYAACAALMVGHLGNLRSTAAYLAVCLFYYAVVLLKIYPLLYPNGTLFTNYYQTPKMTKLELLRYYLGKGREDISLLFSGAGAGIQKTFLYLPLLSPLRYLLLAGVLVLWLTYPDSPPRSNLQYYYSYPVLSLAYIIMPFAWRNAEGVLTKLSLALGQVTLGVKLRQGLGALVLLVLLGFSVRQLLPHGSNEWVAETIDPAVIYQRTRPLRADLLRPLLEGQINSNKLSLAASEPLLLMATPRPDLYLLERELPTILAGKVEPDLVLLDLKAPPSPLGPLTNLDVLIRRLRDPQGAYVALYDQDDILLYRHKAPRQSH